MVAQEPAQSSVSAEEKACSGGVCPGPHSRGLWGGPPWPPTQVCVATSPLPGGQGAREKSLDSGLFWLSWEHQGRAGPLGLSHQDPCVQIVQSKGHFDRRKTHWYRKGRCVCLRNPSQREEAAATGSFACPRLVRQAPGGPPHWLSNKHCAVRVPSSLPQRPEKETRQQKGSETRCKRISPRGLAWLGWDVPSPGLFVVPVSLVWGGERR